MNYLGILSSWKGNQSLEIRVLLAQREREREIEGEQREREARHSPLLSNHKIHKPAVT